MDLAKVDARMTDLPILYVAEAQPRSSPKPLPRFFQHPGVRPEGAGLPAILELFSKPPNGADLARGLVPHRDPRPFLSEIREAGIRGRAIECRINCVGGEGGRALRTVRALLAHPYHVTARITGWCASSAALIALAADRRIAAPGAKLLIHRARRFFVPEQIPELTIDRRVAINDSLNDMDDAQTSLLIDRLGISERLARDWMAEGCELSATEALERGIIHEIEETA
ncbi:ATP-dependent Clp protease proteolytic subunit [Bradyrhizobium sp. USDA 4520]